MKETNEKNVSQISPEQDYSTSFLPSVHRIGRTTMLTSLVVWFLPVVYFTVIRGYTVPFNLYINAILSIAAIFVGEWLSEPEAYWPVLGSAGTYISYLAGDVGSTRVTCAVTCQKSVDADISTPKGQVITIFGLVTSVFVKLVLLAFQVAVGAWFVSLLPDYVIGAFAYVTVGAVAALLVLNIGGKQGIVKGTVGALPYLVVSTVVWWIFKHTPLSTFCMLACVCCSILLAYILYRRDLQKAEESK